MVQLSEEVNLRSRVSEGESQHENHDINSVGHAYSGRKRDGVCEPGPRVHLDFGR